MTTWRTKTNFTCDILPFLRLPVEYLNISAYDIVSVNYVLICNQLYFNKRHTRCSHEFTKHFIDYFAGDFRQFGSLPPRYMCLQNSAFYHNMYVLLFFNVLCTIYLEADYCFAICHFTIINRGVDNILTLGRQTLRR